MQNKITWILLFILAMLTAGVVQQVTKSKFRLKQEACAELTSHYGVKRVSQRNQSLAAKVEKFSEMYRSICTSELRADVNRLRDFSAQVQEASDKGIVLHRDTIIELLRYCNAFLSTRSVERPAILRNLENSCVSEESVPKQLKRLRNATTLFSCQILIHFCLEQINEEVDRYELKFDSSTISILTFEDCLRAGDTWRGDLSVDLYSHYDNIRMTVNDKDILVKNGVGYYEKKLTPKTKKLIEIKASTTNPLTGEVRCYTQEFEIPICNE
jgi:hypothetical protein